MNRIGSRGYTLLEVVVSMLVTAIVATSVFSLALSTKRSGAKGLHKLVAGQGARQVSEILKNYVSGDWTTSAADLPIDGPSETAAMPWQMTQGSVQDSCSDSDPAPASCYALAVGSHTLKGYLPSWFENPPYNARVKYHVTDTGNAGGFVPKVSVTVRWDEIP